MDAVGIAYSLAEGTPGSSGKPCVVVVRRSAAANAVVAYAKRRRAVPRNAMIRDRILVTPRSPYCARSPSFAMVRGSL